MKWFEIESTAGTGDFARHMIHAKSYEDACGKIRQLEGDGHYKLLAIWEPMEIDKKVMKRTA